MKKVIVLLVVVVGMINASGQGCLPNGITFYEQEDIDLFQFYYPDCSVIEGSVFIGKSGGSDINNLFGLLSLTSIEGNVNISNNPALTSLEGLDNLIYINGYLQIANNSLLSNLNGLDNLESIGYLSIGFNDTLLNLNGLESLHTLDGFLQITENKSLINLQGLENLTSIHGGFSIGNNGLLTSLEAIENVTMISGAVYIGGNAVLTKLSGLENISPGSIEHFFIMGNSMLSSCNVESLCDYLLAPNGLCEIIDNAPGCNSIAEIEETCNNAVEEISLEYKILIIPNPAKDKITISSPAITSNTLLSIFNVSGEKVLEMQLTETETQLNISALPRGVYFVRLQNEKMVEVAKMMKE